MRQRAIMTADRGEVLAATLSTSAAHERWIASYEAGFNSAFYECATDEILSRIKVPEGSVFMDAGCGNAAKSVRLARRGFRVKAIDFSPSALALAKQNVKDLGLEDRIEVSRENICQLSYPDATVPNIWCWGVLMHVPDIDEALDELCRVLAPGGWLILEEINMHSVQDQVRRLLKGIIGDSASATPVECGIERWKSNAEGRLLIRHTRVSWLIGSLERRGLSLQHRLSGEFTEAYVHASSRLAKRLICAFNSAWFKYRGSPRLAFCNVLIFRKKSGQEPRPAHS